MSRAGVDFFVHLVYESALLGVACVVAAIVGYEMDALSQNPAFALVLVGVIILGSGYLWYLLAVRSSTQLHRSVRALVHLGRLELAKKLGLDLPLTIEMERDMWHRVTVFSFYSYESEDRRNRGNFDQFRTKPSTESASSEEPSSDEGRSQ